jgi:uncharacterized protein (TIGR03790 family)
MADPDCGNRRTRVRGARNGSVWTACRLGMAWICPGLLMSIPTVALAQSGANVLVVANESNAASVQIAERYAQARSLPPDNVLRLKSLPADPPEVISRLAYDGLIQRPIADWLVRRAAHDRILYIVLTKGIPLRIEGSNGRTGTQASVDSELTLLYRALTGRPLAPQGRTPNPYFAGNTPLGELKRFTHRDQDIFLVTRLDGFTLEDVLALIDRGISPTRDGRVLFDQKAALDDPGNTWLRAAAERMSKAGFADRVVLESTSQILTGEPNVLGYFSWGSADPAIKSRQLGLGFVPGALAATFVSTDARTFREPPAEWTPGSWENQKTHFAGSPQSLIGDLLREGATGAAGYVTEPYLDAAIRPDLLFPSYFAGFNLAESFYLAMPYLSWQTVVVGDPLCAPFRAPETVALPAEIDPQVDPETELPGFFANRRLEILARKGLNREAVKLLLRGEARLGRDESEAGRKALEAATSMEERLSQAHTLLATLLEAAGEHDLAIDRYRRILAHTPRDPVALNNLAYELAVRKNQPADALPIAERARLLEPRNPLIVDTLGLIHHLLGNHTEALRFLAQAVKGAPANPEIRLHAAAAHLAAGQLDAAERELTRAVALRPDLEAGAEVNELRTKINESRR